MKPRKIHNVSEKMTTRQSKPKLATLPLPRELRDHIYGYLFTTTFFVEAIWIGDTPSQVDIRPAILDVSMSTRQEAKKALYRNGHFHFDAYLSFPPPPFDEIEYLPCIELLQNITVRFDTRSNFWYGRDPNAVTGVTKLIDYIAKLDYSAPRTSLVMNLIAARGDENFLGASDDAGNLKDALSRLSGFKKVEIKLEWDQMRQRNLVLPFVQALDEKLAITLGDSERVFEEGLGEGRSCLVYHPQNR